MSAVPQNPRRMLAKQEEGNNAGLDQHYGLLDLYDIKEFPMWLSTSDRLLLRLSPADLKADAVVAQDGRGNYVSIIDAVKEAPAYLRNNKYIIYVKARVYHETVRISKRKTNITFVGDGKGKTVVVSSKNVKDGSTTLALLLSVLFHTFLSATFDASAVGFLARDDIHQQCRARGHQTVTITMQGPRASNSDSTGGD